MALDQGRDVAGGLDELEHRQQGENGEQLDHRAEQLKRQKPDDLTRRQLELTRLGEQTHFRNRFYDGDAARQLSTRSSRTKIESPL